MVTALKLQATATFKICVAILIPAIESFVTSMTFWAKGDWVTLGNICPPNNITVFTCKLTITFNLGVLL